MSPLISEYASTASTFLLKPPTFGLSLVRHPCRPRSSLGWVSPPMPLSSLSLSIPKETASRPAVSKQSCSHFSSSRCSCPMLTDPSSPRAVQRSLLHTHPVPPLLNQAKVCSSSAMRSTTHRSWRGFAAPGPKFNLSPTTTWTILRRSCNGRQPSGSRAARLGARS